jgi:iron complex outermembrane receptor protein
MQRSLKATRIRCTPSRLTRLPLTAAIYLAFGSMAWAQTAAPVPETPTTNPPTTGNKAAPKNQARTLETITVTSQKRVENLQKVPISEQVLGETKLKQQNVKSFQDFAKLLPSVSFGTVGGGVFSGPGFAQVYMRGVASGGDGNHSGSQPSVGMYLDEQPITTIQGALDIHIFDIERIEALAGPQGTLYGASSQAGTIRIITNKPDPSHFASGYAVEANAIQGGGTGHVFDAFVNVPISKSTAIRLVGWQKHDAGYIDNVFGTRTFPTSGITANNAGFVRNNYNTADTVGARAALKIDLNDNWSITPMIMGQHQKAYGSGGTDPSVGDLKVTHFYPEQSDDKWTQAALTVQGKIGNFDLVYAFAHLKRDVDSQADYSDYGYWYDVAAGSGVNFVDNNNAFINPAQHIQAKDGYTKTSHELRLTSPKEDRLRFVAGLFWQQQAHNIFQRYRVDGLATTSTVTGYPDTIWLTAQQREDRDEAVFGEVSFDLTPKLTATGGMRFFRAQNSLKGFFGFGPNFSSSTGESQCFSTEKFHGAPCVNLDKSVRETNSLGRLNLTYQIDPSHMVYATWSQGYRPGGINRKGTLPPYKADFLTNYELGWKTTWADNRLSWNGALFQEDWKDFQFSYLGVNGLTEIRNANQARIRGLESELRWAATYNLAISGGFALYDAKLTQDYCAKAGQPDAALCFVDPTVDVARAGTRLPVTAKFKGNLVARYTFDLAGGEAFWQTSFVHQGDRTTDLREAQQRLLGSLKAYTLTDLSVGFRKNSWSLDVFLNNAFNTRAQLARFAECATLVCGNQPYTVTAPPRTIGVRFSQDF